MKTKRSAYLIFERVVELLQLIHPVQDVRRCAVGLEKVQLFADSARGLFVIGLDLLSRGGQHRRVL